MGIWELSLVALGLSMDAFSVALCKGLAMNGRRNRRNTIMIAVFFGGFQAIMPAAGWLLGRQFARYIQAFDHWIAFSLLAVIGGKMIWGALHKEEDCCTDEKCGASGEKQDIKELFLLAIATSIDALAMGVTLAFLNTDIVSAALLIGACTFTLSYAGVGLGRRFGARLKGGAEIAGGIALVLIGVKILLEHLGVL